MTMKDAIKTYQVPGALDDWDGKVGQFGWEEHRPGTMVFPGGTVYLGMPRGFNRLGPVDPKQCPLHIFESWESHEEHWGFDMFNMPVWKYLDEHGNTLVRGIAPRLNTPFLHVILGNCLDKIQCLEVTTGDLEQMD